MTSEALVAKTRDQHITQVAGDVQLNGLERQNLPSKRRRVGLPALARVYKYDDQGHYKCNRRGVQLCVAFQTGSCSSPCPEQLVHQCKICLYLTHGAKDCPKVGTSVPQQAGHDAKKVKGKKQKGRARNTRPARSATSPEQDVSYEVRVPTRSKLTSEQLRSHDVYIGRRCEKLGLFRSEWCNPFKISRTQTRAAVLQLFAVYARAQLAHKVHLLAGRRLLCHCETHQNCHGDVLIELFKETCCSLSLSKSPLCDGDVPLSSSVDVIAQEMGSDIVQFVNRRQVGAGMGVLILFAGLRRPNSIKNWLVKWSAQYNVAVNIEDFDILSGPGLESRCLRALGSDMVDAGPTAQDLANARAALADLLPGAGPAPPWNDHFSTPVDHVLLAALRSWISDPDDQLERWFKFGAPAGLAFIPLARGVFPTVEVSARSAALVSALTQYMFLDTELAIEVFLDDPCLTVNGSLAQRNKHCHRNSVLAHPWFPVAVQEGAKGSNCEVDRVYTPIDRRGIGDKHQARDLA